MGKCSLNLRKAVIFDRDGIVNSTVLRGGQPTPPRTLNEFEIKKGFKNLYEHALSLDYRLFIATNQPDVHRGLTTREFVQSLHDMIISEYDQIEEIVTCFHDNIHNCSCRKPRPGMVLYLENKYGLNLSKSFFIGDRVGDVLCGNSAGCKTIFVDYKYAESVGPINADYIVSSVEDVLPFLSGEKR